jgi:DNA (cytosine-5)-methyltransferase 1
MTAYYNEIDPKAAAWLRELIRRGLIAPGDVDERSIEDVTPNDLARYTQCHFFAGIGVWSHALRSAGWADDRPVWTGSCPCQPFSVAGKGAGFADERHLWPAFFHLISECCPPVVFGEQVASKDGLGWLDLVHADLEGSGYACGAVDLCAAGVGAPHIRQRLWWVAERLGEPNSAGRVERRQGSATSRHGSSAIPTGGPGLVEHTSGDGRLEWRAEPSGRGATSGRILGRLADAISERGRGGQLGREDAADAWAAGEAGGVANSDGRDASAERQQRGGEQRQQPQDGGTGGVADAAHEQHDGAGIGGARGRAQPANGGDADRPGPTNGFWRNVDWLHCRDGKWRPTEPRIFPLVHGYPARVGLLRGAGNAIVAPAAQAFIEAYLGADDAHLRLTDLSVMTQDMDIFG